METAAIPPAPARPARWLAVAVIVAAILGVPALLDQGAARRQPFDERPLRTLAKARPTGVLLGDSMLETRIDPQALKSVSAGSAGRCWPSRGAARPCGSSC